MNMKRSQSINSFHQISLEFMEMSLNLKKKIYCDWERFEKKYNLTKYYYRNLNRNNLFSFDDNRNESFVRRPISFERLELLLFFYVDCTKWRYDTSIEMNFPFFSIQFWDLCEVWKISNKSIFDIPDYDAIWRLFRSLLTTKTIQNFK